MKKIAVIILAAFMVIGLVACGSKTTTTTQAGGGDATQAGGGDATQAGGGDATQGGGTAVSGEVVNVGDFEVLVPNGWMKYPQEDISSDADADGNYPILTDAYGMIKGGKDAFDALTEPTVYVYYYPDLSAEEQYESTKLWFDEPTTDIDVTVNGTKCLAFEIEPGGGGMFHQAVFIPVGDGACFKIYTQRRLSEETSLTVDDADVKAIMESLKVK